MGNGGWGGRGVKNIILMIAVLMMLSMYFGNNDGCSNDEVKGDAVGF